MQMASRMKTAAAGALTVATLFCGATARGQDFTPVAPTTAGQNAPQPPPPPPPVAAPQYTPAPPPPAPPPVPPQYDYPPTPPLEYYPPVYYRPPPPLDDGKTHFTIRASGGVAFLSTGYYCGYFYNYYVAAYACGAGYATAQPDVNVDVDVWFDPTLGITLGANVMWGTYTPNVVGVPGSNVYSTTWEPHLDVLLAPTYGSNQFKGRVRLGFGLYIAEVYGVNTVGQTVQYNGVGGAFRLGFGVSILPKSKVGIGVDAIFESGWIGSNYVSTVQLLLGPELHF